MAPREDVRRGLTARQSTSALYVTAAVILVTVAAWAGHHVLSVAGLFALATPRSVVAVTLLYAAGFAIFAAQMVLCYLERPYRTTTVQQAVLDRLNVAVLVPTYNEDPAALQECIKSKLGQVRRPQTVCVVDDGSVIDYSGIREWAAAAAAAVGVQLVWICQPNQGKRAAQAAGVRATPEADVYWTSDSDTASDPHALDEMLKPLSDQRVQSVAGVMLARNNARSWLARITDLWYVTAQLVDRSALSTIGAVWVNSGPVAIYRAPVVRDNLDAYLGETFFGRRVGFSDDSKLTLFAMMRGRTVQQPTAFAFTLLPEQISHHLRVYVRWMRGSFIRSWWRAKYLPLTSVAYWAHVTWWVQTAITAATFVVVAVIGPAVTLDVAILPWLLVVTIALGYCQTLRYLTVTRSDRTRWWQIRSWLISPAAILWAAVVLRAVRWYAVATCLKTGWGTRDQVEVRLLDGKPTPHPR